MKNAAMHAILLFGLCVSCSVYAIGQQADLPPDCEKADFKDTGRPIFFALRNGIAMGISSEKQTFEAGRPIPIYVWVNNQTEREQHLMTCSMWWDWDIDLFGSDGLRIETKREKKLQNDPIRRELQMCGREFALVIPAHSCAPLFDMRDVTIDLNERYELGPGDYFVTEKKSTTAPPRLLIEVVVAGQAQR